MVPNLHTYYLVIGSGLLPATLPGLGYGYLLDNRSNSCTATFRFRAAT